MDTLTKPPVSLGFLERFRLRTRQIPRPAPGGAHAMRRKGQSLEFRDFGPYVPGMDARHIDWRVSARHGTPTEFMVREFDAEENCTILISIDNRETMGFPEELSKLEMAAWIAWVIGGIGLLSGDRVVLHRMFGGSSRDCFGEIMGETAAPRLWGTLQHLLRSNGSFLSEGNDSVNLHGIGRVLPPSSVWIILSDFYFPASDPPARKLLRALHRARNGWRWIIATDLDTWAWERHLVGHGPRRLDGPGIAAGEPAHVEVEDDGLASVQQKVESNKERLMGFLPASSRIHWPWPQSPIKRADMAHEFPSMLAAQPLLQDLFVR